MRPRMLADDLADLISPAPGPELDPDELALGDAAATAGADEQLLGLLHDQGPPRQVGTPQGLGLRGAHDLAADPTYSGRRSSRAALFGGDDDDHQPLMNGFGSTSSSEEEGDGAAAGGDEEDDPVSRYIISPEASEDEAPASGPSSSQQAAAAGVGQAAGAQPGTPPYMNGVAGHTSSSSSSSESEQAAAQEQEQEHTEQPLQLQQPQAEHQDQSGSGSGSEKEEQAAGSSSEAEDAPDHQPQGASPMEDAEEEAGAGSEEQAPAPGVEEELEAAAAAFQDDPALQELDRQYEAMQAAAAPPLAQEAARAAREAAKGAAVSGQRALWERTLHLRILLQRPVAAAAALPRPGVASLFRSSHPGVEAGYQQLLGSCAGLLEDLLQLHAAAASQHPAAAAALAAASQPGDPQQQQPAGAAAGRKRSHAAASASDQQQQQQGGSGGGLGEALWARVEGAVTGLAPFRDAALDKWHRRTVLSSGGAALSGNSLRALQQGVSKQVATLLADPTKVVRRSQLPTSLAPRPLGALPQQQQQLGGGHSGMPGTAGTTIAGGEDDRDAETYDDGDFYQQLLKELLESSGEGARAAAGARAPKRRKVVDRRASKGRKIRYHVLDKLVNFMAPVELVPPPFATQLFSNLFGYKQRTVQ